ncbi:hypothetical protein [Moraxella lacunata]|uniref:hypothetical protein n=1 Tax=Moraxella lacunata TaxID=477 RepID=UPI0015F0728C|nr:hypothetical protein [Moraxella lacunata]
MLSIFSASATKREILFYVISSSPAFPRNTLIHNSTPIVSLPNAVLAGFFVPVCRVFDR